jgi:ABC-2 type transport system permease protein
MAWQKILLVLKREYWINFKRKSFLFSAFGVPLLTFGAMFLIARFTANNETDLSDFNRIGVVDRAGIVTVLENPDASAGSDEPEYVLLTNPDEPVPSEDDPEARAAYFDALVQSAREQFEAGELDGYLVISDDYVLTGLVDLYVEGSAPAALSSSVRNFMRRQIVSRVPDSLAVPPERIAAPVEEVLRDIETGEELSTEALLGRMFVPFIFVFIYFLATSTTAQFLMNGVVEEKETRLMEILATSVRPIELLWGKMLGLAALAFTQIGLWLVAAIALALSMEEAREALAGVNFAPLDIVLVVVMFVANFLLFAAMMLGIGAASTAEAESRQVAGILTFIGVLPMAGVITFFTNPDGPIPLFFSFFPLTAATGILLRFGLTNVPMWQILLSLAIQIVSVFVVMWLSAKVFRLGMLMYGKRLTPRAMWQALREGRSTLTTASEPASGTFAE